MIISMLMFIMGDEKKSFSYSLSSRWGFFYLAGGKDLSGPELEYTDRMALVKSDLTMTDLASLAVSMIEDILRLHLS